MSDSSVDWILVGIMALLMLASVAVTFAAVARVFPKPFAARIDERQFWPRFSPRHYWRMRKWRRYWKHRKETVLHAAWSHWLTVPEGPNPWPL